VLGLEEGLVDEGPGMLVDQAVVDTGALLSGGDHPRPSQLREVL